MLFVHENYFKNRNTEQFYALAELLAYSLNTVSVRSVSQKPISWQTKKLSVMHARLWNGNNKRQRAGEDFSTLFETGNRILKTASPELT